VGNGLNDAPGLGNGDGSGNGVGSGNGSGGNGPNRVGNGVNPAADGVDNGEAAAPASSVKAPRALSEAETDAELASGELAELDPILEEARQANGGRVVGVALVEADGLLLFEVRMIGGEQVDNLYYDARSGRPVGGR